MADTWINGGYFFFKREILKYLSKDDGCVLEREPLVNLARDRELGICKHRGFWYAMDTQRDREYLDELWKSGKAPVERHMTLWFGFAAGARYVFGI